VNTYRAMFILSTSLKDEDLKAAMDRVRQEIAGFGGETGAVKVMGKRTFARPMKKRDAGVYVLLWFRLDPANVSALRGRFKLNEDIFRSQVLHLADSEFVADPDPTSTEPDAAGGEASATDSAPAETSPDAAPREQEA